MDFLYAAVSNEQTDGIRQINNAMAEMEGIIEDNAAEAEESAATSELMKAHAEKLKEIVSDLDMLIHGVLADQLNAA